MSERKIERCDKCGATYDGESAIRANTVLVSVGRAIFSVCLDCAGLRDLPPTDRPCGAPGFVLRLKEGADDA